MVNMQQFLTSVLTVNQGQCTHCKPDLQKPKVNLKIIWKTKPFEEKSKQSNNSKASGHL